MSSNNALPSPAPENTPIVDSSGAMSIAWRVFFKIVGDFLLGAFRPRKCSNISAGGVSDCTYYRIGQIVFIEYTGSGATASGLPYALPSYLTTKSGTAFDISGSSITFPSAAKGFYITNGGI